MLESLRFRLASLSFHCRLYFEAKPKMIVRIDNWHPNMAALVRLPTKSSFTSAFVSSSLEIFGFGSKYMYHECFVLTCFRQPLWLAKPSCSQLSRGPRKSSSLWHFKWSLLGLWKAPCTAFQSTSWRDADMPWCRTRSKQSAGRMNSIYIYSGQLWLRFGKTKHINWESWQGGLGLRAIRLSV